MTTATGTATYRKTRTGEWVVMAPAAMLHPGTTIAVRKRDGSIKQEHIWRVGRPFAADGQQMAYGYLAATTGQRTTRRSQFSVERCHYGHATPVRGCTDCFDTFD